MFKRTLYRPTREGVKLISIRLETIVWLTVSSGLVEMLLTVTLGLLDWLTISTYTEKFVLEPYCRLRFGEGSKTLLFTLLNWLLE